MPEVWEKLGVFSATQMSRGEFVNVWECSQISASAAGALFDGAIMGGDYEADTESWTLHVRCSVEVKRIGSQMTSMTSTPPPSDAGDGGNGANGAAPLALIWVPQSGLSGVSRPKLTKSGKVSIPKVKKEPVAKPVAKQKVKKKPAAKQWPNAKPAVVKKSSEAKRKAAKSSSSSSSRSSSSSSSSSSSK